MTIGRRIAVAVVVGAGTLSVPVATVRADLETAVRQASPADVYRAPIDKYVSELIARVQAGDAKAAPAREELCKQLEANIGGSPPSASFQTIYVSAVISHLQPLLTSPDVMVRLNAGIIVSRMCASTPYIQLSPLAITLMGDKAAAVSLWGIKAGGALLPSVLSVKLNAQNQKITPAIVAAVKAHADTAAILQDAYTALTPDPQPPAPPLPPEALAACAATICDVLDLRVKEYQAGNPASSQSDRTALLFLVRQTVLNAMQPAQRSRTIQTISNLLIASATRAAATTDATARGDLYAIVASSAGSMYAAMNIAGNTSAAGAYNGLLKVPGMMTGAQIVQQAVAAVSEVNKTADYKDVKPLAAN